MVKKFNITIIAEASEKVGYGHVRRSQELFKEFKKLGHKVNFFILGKKYNFHPTTQDI